MVAAAYSDKLPPLTNRQAGSRATGDAVPRLMSSLPDYSLLFKFSGNNWSALLVSSWSFRNRSVIRSRLRAGEQSEENEIALELQP